MKMTLLCSIVLLKMKAQEKSRHCPFLEDNSASSASGTGAWQEVSDKSSKQTGRFWREYGVCFWQGEDPKGYGYCHYEHFLASKLFYGLSYPNITQLLTVQTNCYIYIHTLEFRSLAQIYLLFSQA